MMNNFFNIFDDFDDFNELENLLFGTADKKQYKAVKRCPSCGRSYFEFEKTGKLGCDKCYETFHDELSTLLRQIHSNNEHIGKIPKGYEGEVRRKRQYENLKKQLAEAVRSEDYEKAAKLHKEIKAMEKR